jgi:hypothetical protein
MSIEAMKQALEALDEAANVLTSSMFADAAAALREAIEQAEQRQWVGLTNKEIEAVMQGSVEGERMLPYQFARAIETKLKAKNNG